MQKLFLAVYLASSIPSAAGNALHLCFDPLPHTKSSRPAGRSVHLQWGSPQVLLDALRQLHVRGGDADLVHAVGWPVDDSWYAAPSADGVGSFLRKSQLPADGVLPRRLWPHVHHAEGTDGPTSVCLAGPVANSSGTYTWQPRLVPSNDAPATSSHCLHVQQLHAPAGIGRGTMTFTAASSCADSTILRLWEVLPWFVERLPGSTVCWDGSGALRTPQVRAVQSPINRGRPGVVEWTMTLEPHNTVYCSYRYQSALLHAEELPPNTHHGVQLPPVHVEACGTDGEQHCTAWWLPPVLMELPPLDFSMVYNIIVFCSTALAFTAGSVLNSIARKPRKVQPTAIGPAQVHGPANSHIKADGGETRDT